jgi:acetyltransferase-like isoleucine patch superfamily enzyme
MSETEWEPPEGWNAWMEELDLLCWVPRPVFARPAGLGSLGSDSYIIEPYKIRSPHRIHIGDNVAVGERAFLSVIEMHNGQEHESSLRIGDGTLISSDLFVHCSGSVEIGDNVAISARVFIGDSARDHDDPTQTHDDMLLGEPMPVRIEDGAGVGVGAIILPGVTIGERALIGAGSVVTRDVPPRSLVFGNPARVIKSWDQDTGRWRAGR